MDYAEIVILVMAVGWFMPMGLLVSFLMWRSATPELDAWIASAERSHAKEFAQSQIRKHETFAYDLNNIDLSKVTPSMLKPKVSSKKLKMAH